MSVESLPAPKYKKNDSFVPNINYSIYDLPDTPAYTINIPQAYKKEFEKFKQNNNKQTSKHYIPQLIGILLLVLVGVLKWVF